MNDSASSSTTASAADKERRSPGLGAGFLTRVKIRNYKSIAACDVELAQLTVLVGRNGAGKSNFLDALRFLVEGLETSIEFALRSRGGIEAVRRHSTGHPHNFGIQLEFLISPHERAQYGFEIAARRPRGFVVRRESLRVWNPATGDTRFHYDVAEGVVVRSNPAQLPAATADRLFLLAASSIPEFRPAYDALRAMGFYNLNPEQMKQLQSPDAGDLLHRDGSNIASVIGRLRADNPAAIERVDQYLNAIVPGITGVERAALGPKETLKFRQTVKGSEHPWSFYAVSMSDGTLRALGSLIAVTQLTNGAKPVRLVGIEEPETALHPSAAGALMDALREASESTQVLVTTHSPDLLDQVRSEDDSVLVVESRDGTTALARVDEPGRTAIHDHLYTAGELQRMGQLQPDEDEIKRQEQLILFDDEARS